MKWIGRDGFLILLGCLLVSGAIIVWVLNQNVSSDVLAGMALIGGVAVIVNSLPDDGDD